MMTGKPAAVWMPSKKIWVIALYYRNAIFPIDAIKAGMQLSFTLNIENVGYASPYNARPVELIMRNKTTNKEFVFTIDTDVRKWYYRQQRHQRKNYY